MSVIVDTSVWIDFFRGDSLPDLEAALQECRIHTTPLIISELISGAKANEEKSLTDFLMDLPLVDTALDHWIRVGKLRQKCVKGGFQISTPDAHIAQACLDTKFSLMTQDKIFTKVQKLIGLKIELS